MNLGGGRTNRAAASPASGCQSVLRPGRRSFLANMPLIAAARYLVAKAATSRSQRQTFEIARRLHRGERLYGDDEAV